MKLFAEFFFIERVLFFVKLVLPSRRYGRIVCSLWPFFDKYLAAVKRDFPWTGEKICQSRSVKGGITLRLLPQEHNGAKYRKK